MAERNADNAEQIVEEVKRKARRRLVGAVVLALGAAIVLPLLLEKEPRPLGGEVSVQIPPIDEGKFVNRLTGKAGDTKALPKVESKAPAVPDKSDAKPGQPAPSAPAPASPTVSPEGAPAAKKSVTEAEQRVLAPGANAAPKAEARPIAVPESGGTTKTAPKAEAPAALTPPPKSDPKPAVAASNPAPAATGQSPPAAPAAVPLATNSAIPATAPAAAPAVPAANAEGFVVQLAAFADDKGANALASKLKKSGYAAYVQPVETSRGTLWRVRVGGYASRPEAEAARATLKGEGYNGMTAPAQ
jgi:DedD protein